MASTSIGASPPKSVSMKTKTSSMNAKVKVQKAASVCSTEKLDMKDIASTIFGRGLNVDNHPSYP